MELPLDKVIIKFILFFPLRTQNDVVNKLPLQGQKSVRLLSPEKEKQLLGPKECHFSPSFPVLSYVLSAGSSSQLPNFPQAYVLGGVRWGRVMLLKKNTCFGWRDLFPLSFWKKKGKCDSMFCSCYHFAYCLP